MDVLALISASIIVGLLIILVTKAISSLRQCEVATAVDIGAIDNAERRQRQPVVIGGRRTNVNQRRRPAAAEREPDFDDLGDEDDMAESFVDEFDDGKIGKKKLAKLQAKAEKKSQREYEEQERARKKKLEAEVLKAEKLQLDKEKLEEQQRLEEEKKVREEREKRELEEYLALKEGFCVEEEGFDENVDQNEENLLNEFISFIKATKVVNMEDLSAKFSLKAADAVERIKNLVAEGQLTGVIDDRGKFIFISPEELLGVAKFINQRGRISVAELVEYSNQLIKLEPTNS